MKRLTLPFMLACSLMAFSANKVNVHLRTGDIISYDFQRQPKVTYTDGNVVMTTLDATVEYPLLNVEKCTFTLDATEVASTKVTSTEAGNTYVYDSSGRLLRVIPQGIPVETAGWGSGIYIITNDNTTYKITIR